MEQLQKMPLIQLKITPQIENTQAQIFIQQLLDQIKDNNLQLIHQVNEQTIEIENYLYPDEPIKDGTSAIPVTGAGKYLYLCIINTHKIGERADRQGEMVPGIIIT